jgi:hypothetical protein
MKGRSAPNAIVVGENSLGFDAGSFAFLPQAATCFGKVKSGNPEANANVSTALL